MSQSAAIRKFFMVLLTLGGLFFAAKQINVEQLFASVSAIGIKAVLMVGILLVINILVVNLRLYELLTHYGHYIKYRTVLTINVTSQFAGLLFFSAVGQTISRSVILKSESVPVATTVLISIYERIITAFVSLLFALLGAFFLLKPKLNSYVGGAELLHLLTCLVITISLCSFLLNRVLKDSLKDVMGRFSIRRVGSAFGVSMAGQALVALGYIILGLYLVPSVDILKLASGTLIIMFLASFPISFGGWGVRELSAVYIFRAIGIEAAHAFTMAAVIGSLSIVALCIVYLGIKLVPKTDENEVSEADLQKLSTPPIVTPQLLGWLIPWLTAAVVFFQIHVPTGSGELNVNMADPLVIIGGGLFLYLWIKYSREIVTWRVPGMAGLFAAATGVIIFGFVKGWLDFGFTSWAFSNRLVGWFILLGYLLSGAVVVIVWGKEGRNLVLRTMFLSACIISAFELIIMALLKTGWFILPTFNPNMLAGFAQNRNAFAIQLLVALCIGIVMHPKKSGLLTDHRLWNVGMGIVLAALWFSGSKAGIIMAVLILLGEIFRSNHKKSMILVMIIALCIFSLIRISSWTISRSSSESTSTAVLEKTRYSIAASNQEHWLSIMQGFRLWQQHPILGAGLGASIHKNLGTSHQPLVIHNTYVWILAEFGIFGLLVFMALGGTIAKWALAESRRKDTLEAHLMLLLISGFVLISMVHEILYQRIFWITLGCLLVCPSKIATKNTES